MRAYDDEVAVRTRDDGRDGVEPDAFVWRGRLYAVHLVLDRWVQRRPWWRLAFETPAGAQACAEGDVLSDVEEDVWRVEAAPGESVCAQVAVARQAGATSAYSPITCVKGG